MQKFCWKLPWSAKGLYQVTQVGKVIGRNCLIDQAMLSLICKNGSEEQAINQLQPQIDNRNEELDSVAKRILNDAASSLFNGGLEFVVADRALLIWKAQEGHSEKMHLTIQQLFETICDGDQDEMEQDKFTVCLVNP